MTKKVLTSILIILLALTLAVGGTFAWFLIENRKEFFGYSGNIDLGVKAYVGIDENKDGVLDPNIAATDRGSIVANQYTEMTKSVVNEHQNVYYGKVLTYKIIIINADNENSASLSVNFADMREYFYKQVDYYSANNKLPAMSELIKTFNDNTCRLWFSLSGLTVNIYSKDGAGANDFTSGFSTLVKTSGNPTDPSVTKIPKINDIAPNDGLLYNYSSSEKFIDGVILEKSQLMEINFTFICEQKKTGIETYANKAGAYYFTKCKELFSAKKPAVTDAYINGYISAMCRAEGDYLFTDSVAGQNFIFTIPYIYIKGVNV